MHERADIAVILPDSALEHGLAFAQATSTDPPSRPDAILFEKLDRVRALSDQVVIDGKGNGWRDIPSCEADPNRKVPDATRHIIRVAIAIWEIVEVPIPLSVSTDSDTVERQCGFL